MPDNSGAGEGSVKVLADLDFGTYIAFFLPGVLAFYGLSPLSTRITDLFVQVTAKDQSLGASLLLVISGLIVGTLVSGIRAVTLDPLVHFVGRVKKPELDYASLRSKEDRAAYKEALGNTYRFYQFYGNMVLSLALFAGVRYLLAGVDFRSEKPIFYLVIATLAGLLVQSRQSLAGTYRVLGQILGIKTAELKITTGDVLTGGEVGKAYTYSMRASGGTPPYGWAVGSSASLPAGLTLASDGAISGTPSARGKSNFVVVVSDGAGASKALVCSIEVK